MFVGDIILQNVVLKDNVLVSGLLFVHTNLFLFTK